MKEITTANMKRVQSVKWQELGWWQSQNVLDEEMKRRMEIQDKPRKTNQPNR